MVESRILLTHVVPSHPHVFLKGKMFCNLRWRAMGDSNHGRVVPSLRAMPAEITDRDRTAA
jgi:hypothetical protein